MKQQGLHRSPKKQLNQLELALLRANAIKSIDSGIAQYTLSLDDIQSLHNELASIPSNHMRAIRMPEVQEKTGLSKTHIYRLVKAGNFPKFFHLSERAIAFFESDIDLWLEERSSGRIA